MSSSSSDLRVRSERLRALTLGRVVLGSALFGGLSTVGRDLVLSDSWVLLGTVAVVYAAVQLVALFAPPGRPSVTVSLTEAALLVDVAALAVVLAATGGAHSPLSPLLLTQVVAVTLLFGRWAGLRAALLGSLAVGWLLATTPTLALTPELLLDPALLVSADATVRAVQLLLVLWATTLITGWLSGVTERELRGRTEDLTLLREITPELDPRQGPQRVAQAIAEVVVERFGHAAAALWLASADGSAAGPGRAGGDRLTLVGKHATRIHPSLQDLGTELTADHAVFAGDQPVRALSPDRPHPSPLDAVFGAETPLLVAPLTLEQRRIGVLVVAVRRRVGRRAVVRSRQVRLVRMLVEQAALLLDNARLQAELAEQATRDAVTGLPNHRFFQQRLGEELERVGRRAERGEQRAVSLAVLDLDRFKAVNDTYGHPTGDRVLAAVGAAVGRTLRDTDVVCRYGGEEFAAVLVDTDAEAARITVERLREAIRGLRLEATDGRPLGPVTASAGIATVIGRSETRAALIDRADTALYAAKHAGRDRALHHRDLPVVRLADPDAGHDLDPDRNPGHDLDPDPGRHLDPDPGHHLDPDPGHVPDPGPAPVGRSTSPAHLRVVSARTEGPDTRPGPSARPEVGQG